MDLAAVDTRRLKRICEQYGVASLEVFVSVSRGDDTAESDIDLLRGQIVYTPQYVAVPPKPLGGRIDLIIVGGESGPGSRPCWTPAVRSVVRQCERAGVTVFVKQLGANVQDRNDAGFDGEEPNHWPDMDPADVEHDLTGYRDGYQGAPVRVHLRDRKGADMEEWPEDLRIRQLPEVAHA